MAEAQTFANLLWEFFKKERDGMGEGLHIAKRDRSLPMPMWEQFSKEHNAIKVAWGTANAGRNIMKKSEACYNIENLKNRFLSALRVANERKQQPKAAAEEVKEPSAVEKEMEEMKAKLAKYEEDAKVAREAKEMEELKVKLEEAERLAAGEGK